MLDKHEILVIFLDHLVDKRLKQSALNKLNRLTGRPVEERAPFKALDDVNFSVEQGEVLGIIGHNGAILVISKAEIQREKLVFDPIDSLGMRTTLDSDEDVLVAAKELAKRQNLSAGQVVSRLLRKVLTGQAGQIAVSEDAGSGRRLSRDFVLSLRAGLS